MYLYYLHLSIFNGGGTGSIFTTSNEPWITEVTVGSGFLSPHLFDYYSDFSSTGVVAFGVNSPVAGSNVPSPYLAVMSLINPCSDS